jgi:steroid 5-alpha reductase family enzyme
MTFVELAALAAGAVAVLMLATWTASLRRRDASIVDSVWGAGFALIALLGLALGAGPVARRALVAAMVVVWGARLSIHIYRRNRGRGEDYRYRAMRERHGERFGRVSLWTVFLLQGALMLLIATPILAATTAPAPGRLGPLDVAGFAIWLAGFLFETIGDAQLARFKTDPANRGRVMDRGLWRYSRHPNYFGDALLWWGIFLPAASTPWGWATAIGPALMTFLLLRVSGVALLEQGLESSKPGWRDYARRTSAFVPWFPRHRRESGGADGSVHFDRPGAAVPGPPADPSPNPESEESP